MVHEYGRVLARENEADAVRHEAPARGFDAEARAHQGRPLPPEFAALERAGLPPGSLFSALAEADRAGVAPFDALLAGGAFDEQDLVRTLARSLGVDVMRMRDFRAPAIDADTFQLALQTGYLSYVGPEGALRFVVAARGAAVARLAATRRGQPRTDAIALASPRAFADLAVALAGTALARRAAEGPARVSPELTVAHALPKFGRAAKTAMAAAVLAIASASLAFGGVAAALLAAVGLLFAGLNAFRLWLAMVPSFESDRPAAAIADADLPVYTVLVALHREAAIIPSLLANLEKLDYPPAKLDIKILVEAGDVETLQALAARPPRAGVEVLALPPGGPRTKPRALNAGLLAARGGLVTVYDAEDRPESQQLRKAAAVFSRSGPDLACLQARLAIDNIADGWLVRHFAIEYAALFDVVLPALAALKLPIPLGGTSNHFRASALRRVGGWDAGNVTEDADLGLRLARDGWRIGTLRSVTWEEAPTRVWPWIRQRTRWMKGFLTTALVHNRRPAAFARSLDPVSFLAAQLLVGGVALTALFYPVMVALILWNGFSGALLAPRETGLDLALAGFHVLNLVVGFSAALACGWIGIDRRCPQRLAADLATLPIYWLLVGAAAWRALWQLMTESAPRWEKTTHGVSRRRATPAQP